MDWRLQLSRLHFGFLGIEAFPDLAAGALAEGEDTPSLRILAGLGRQDPFEIRKYLADFQIEAGIVAPGPEEAARLVIPGILNEIIDRKISMRTGIYRLYWKIFDEFHDDGKFLEKKFPEIFKLYCMTVAYDDLCESTECWDPVKDNKTLMKEYEDDIYTEVLNYRKEKYGY